ncbi:MAG TPA: SpoIIE family protein phosphatase [Pyrinomonadaceae bacterium]|jgi:serine phosphatase RsbU (regulator of sigma subunit)/pSer/pThr/pTyr-binding forkhead associated (FHA) protein|nr:SpoIIE family protein phosphatase [Pyrinomonadaceae bacterium]
MSELIVKYPDRAPDHFPLGRLRITIGRSARNDLCIPDPFASRVHAEVRREGDEYVLQDLGSANGTLYNGGTVQGVIPLTAGGRIQIGETEIIFDDGTYNSSMGATMITDNSESSLPEATIALASGDRTTSGLLEAIEGARTKPEEVATSSGGKAATATKTAKQGDLLALISKVGITLLASATLNETLEQIVSLVFESVPADRCLIMMRDQGSEDLRVAVARLRDRVGEVGEIRVSRNVLDEVVIRGKSVLTSDAQHDPRFASGTVVLQGVRSVLAVPLGVADKVFGIIYADSPIAEGRFTEDHLKVLTTLASVAAIRVENTQLIEERLERERLERELALASEIQQRFQPTAPPTVPGYELQGISFPCYEIGGDYYDFIERDDGRLVIALGDVSGKGTAAALLMSSLHAAVHAQSGSHDTLVATISAVNKYLADNIPANRFVTLFYAELDPGSGSLSFLNAGHNPPLIVHAAGTVEQLASGGLPLGIKRDADYREGRTQLQLGDVLVIYSDGVTEACSPSGEEFGPTRLYEVVSRNIEASAAGIRDRIESSLTKFSQGTSAADDITLVIVKRQAEARHASSGG